MISEPGRYFAMPSACAVAQVFSKKPVAASVVKQGSHLSIYISDYLPKQYKLPAVLNNEDKGFMYYITDGVFGSFNCCPVYRIRPPFMVLGKVRVPGVLARARERKVICRT